MNHAFPHSHNNNWSGPRSLLFIITTYLYGEDRWFVNPAPESVAHASPDSVVLFLGSVSDTVCSNYVVRILHTYYVHCIYVRSTYLLLSRRMELITMISLDSNWPASCIAIVFKYYVLCSCGCPTRSISVNYNLSTHSLNWHNSTMYIDTARIHVCVGVTVVEPKPILNSII